MAISIIKKIPIWVYFLALSGLTLLWFKTNTIIYVHDEVIPLDPVTDLKNYWSLWRSDTNFGAATSGGLPKLVSVAVFACLYEIFHNIQYVEMVLYVLMFFCAFYGSYLLIKKVLNLVNIKNTYANIVGSFTYTTSPFFIFYIWRLNYIMTRSWFFAFIPILIYSYVSLLQTKNKKSTFKYLLVFILSSILISPSFSHPAFFLITLLFFIIFFVIFYIVKRPYLSNKVMFIKAILYVCLFICVNSFWLLPRTTTFSSELAGAQNGIGTNTVVADNSMKLNFANNSTLTETPALYDNPAWYSWSSFYTSSYLFKTASIIILIFVVYGVVKSKSKIIYFLFLVFLTCSLFMMGTSPPFVLIKKWLFIHLSPLQSFRDPGKWGFAGIIILSILVAYVTALLYIKFSNNKKIKIILLSILPVCLIICSWPYFTGQLIPSNYKLPGAQISIPNDYYSASSYLKTNNLNDSPILQLPVHGSHNSAKWSDDNGYKSVDVLKNLTSLPILDSNSPSSYKNIQNQLENSFRKSTLTQTSFSNLLDSSGIKFIVINKDTNSDILKNKNSPELYESLLNKYSFLTKVFQSEHLDIYKNNNSIDSLVYSPNSVELIKSKLNEKSNLIADASKIKNSSGSNLVKSRSYPLIISGNMNANSKAYLSFNDTVDTNEYAYLLINYNGITNDSVAVNAQDQTGFSEWLPEVTDTVKKKFVNFPSDTYIYDMSQFNSGKISIDFNVFSQSYKKVSININDVSFVNGIYDTYKNYTSVDTTKNAYVVNKNVDFYHNYNSVVSNVKQMSSTKYNLEISSKNNALIVLKQNNDPDWRLKIGNKEYKPYVINDFQMGWSVNLSDICKEYYCKNNNGIYDVNASIYLTSNKLIYEGLILSLSSIFLAFILISLKKYDSN